MVATSIGEPASVEPQMIVTPLAPTPDTRGLSLSVAAKSLGELDGIRDIHIAEIRPGQVRGNHYHLRRTELIAVAYDGSWSLHWDTGPNTPTETRSFTGTGGMLISAPRTWSHAIRNDGVSSIWIVALSDIELDHNAQDDSARDVYRREIASPRGSAAISDATRTL